MKLQTTYETRLETAVPSEIEPLLDNKLDATSAFGVADYVAFAIDNLNDRLDRIKKAEAELKALKFQTQSQIETIKEGASEWISGAGLDKLHGDRVSSLTVLKRAVKEDLIITDEEAAINAGYFKTVIDKTAVKNAIKEDADIDFAHLEITHLADSLKVNKKRS